MSRVPYDDSKLGTDEVEGLLVSPSSSSSRKTSDGGGGGSSSSSKYRWGVLMLVVGVLIGALLSSDSESLHFWEGKGGEKVDDVETKGPEPTPPPTIHIASRPPSPNPTPEPTPNPTPNPTPDPTPNPTPDPTPGAVVAPDPTTPPKADQPAPLPAPDPTTTEAPDPTPAPKADVTPDTKAPDPAPKEPPAPDAKAKAIVLPVIPKENVDDPKIDWGAAHYPKPDQVVQPDPPLTSEKAAELAKEWGKWELVDKKAGQRPKDFYKDYANKDVPRDKFPANAWQTDKEYLKDYLQQSLALVERSMEAILAEYGHGKKDDNDDDKSSLEDRIKAMFEFVNYENGTHPKGKGLIPQAGWTTEKSFQGLVRRVLHAIMTNDDFHFILGGHSAAAGHGNQFKQSYAMQFHKIMEPILGMLGVSLTTRNLAQGGLGTLQHALGTKDIYGDSIDIMMWDSGMTEGRDGAAVDLYWRQALLSGQKVPFLIGSGAVGELTYYNQNVDADISNIGEAMVGIPECKDDVQCQELPYAAQYMKCNAESASLCAAHKWGSNCWVDRPDFKPPEKQDGHPGSQVKWHQGFRFHQLTGRVLSMLVLKALRQGLGTWQNTTDFALPDEAWHVTAHYDNIRTKLKTNTEGETKCFQSENWPTRMCTMPINAKTEFTPRANPDITSLTSIVHPNEKGFVPHVMHGNLYNGPDVHNPFTEVPEGAIDVFSIVSNGRKYDNNGRRRRQLETITPGLGWMSGNGAPPGYCDGTYNSHCNRRGKCLLIGHGDARGGLMFDSYSGWLVMTVPQVKEGLLVIKLETWHWPEEMTATKGWKSIDNKGRRRSLLRGGAEEEASTAIAANVTVPYLKSYYDNDMDQEDLRRRLKKPPPAMCDLFTFEFSIDGKITVWNKDDWTIHNKNAQRVVELQTLLDDPNFTKEPKDVELAIRMTGCGANTHKTMSLTHVYWA